jgi:hypothetical protein
LGMRKKNRLGGMLPAKPRLIRMEVKSYQ